MKQGKQGRALRPDAQPFDEIRISTVPRYKMSGISGDEWRISAKVEFLRKGVVRHETSFSNVGMAARLLDHALIEAMDCGHAYYAGEGDTCDQEGCSAQATVTYRRKEEFSEMDPHEWHRPAPEYSSIRRFCQRHARRGDAAFDDCDENYELIDGSREPSLLAAEDESPSVFGGMIEFGQQLYCPECGGTGTTRDGNPCCKEKQ